MWEDSYLNSELFAIILTVHKTKESHVQFMFPVNKHGLKNRRGSKVVFETTTLYMFNQLLVSSSLSFVKEILIGR
jgi:hypothetical protein